MAGDASDRVPECPRCGYDLTGQVAAAGGVAADSFPVRGRCSECGLEFAWGDVFNPGRDRVPGFIEHARAGWWSLFAAAWRTWWMAARVLPFWGRVRLEMPVRVGRVWLWPVVTVVAVSVAGSALSSGLMELSTSRSGRLNWTMHEWMKLHRVIWSSGLADFEWGAPTMRLRWFAPATIVALGPLAAWAVMWLVVSCLSDTRRVSKVRWGHVLRAAVYGLAWLVPIVAWRAATFTLGYVLIAVSRFVPSQPGPSTFARLRRWLYEAMEFAYEAAVFYAVLAVVWLTAWWFFAIRDGWRVREYGRVWLAVAVPGWLALLVVWALMGYGAKLFP